jgi:hypothetical protein
MEEVEETIGSRSLVSLQTRRNEREENKNDHRMHRSVGAFMLRRNNFRR